MSIWNKVLLGLNILVTLGAFYFALQTLHVHQVWRKSAKKHEKRLEQFNQEIEILKQGTDGNGGIRALRIALFKEYFGRGRVWYDCRPEKIKNPEAVNVVVDLPKPHHIPKNLVIYVFEYQGKNNQANNAGNMIGNRKDVSGKRPQIETTRFLGEFVVKHSGPAGVSIAPTMKLDARAIANLKASKGRWMIRELMPLDTRDLFAGKSEEELRQILPEKTIHDYVNDGKDVFARSLRDYRVLLKWHDERRIKQQEAIDAGIRYNKHLEASLADTKQQKQFRQKLNAAMQKELVAISAERDTVLAYEASLRKEIEKRMIKIDHLMNQNRILAQTIQEFQEQALSQINSRTASAR